MSLVDRGALAEDFVFYQLRRRGIEVYRPLHAKQYVDFIIIVDDMPLKCQVKATCTEDRAVGLRHTKYKDGKYTSHPYKNEVDIFFLVDLIRENLFVVPGSVLAGKHNVKLTPMSYIWKYKDRYDLIVAKKDA